MIKQRREKNNSCFKPLWCIFLLMLMFIPMISALGFDNVKEYDYVEREVTITNAFGLGDVIAKIKLLTPLRNSVMDLGQGIKQPVAEWEMYNYQKDYENAYKELKLYKEKNMVEFERDFEYRYGVEKEEIYYIPVPCHYVDFSLCSDKKIEKVAKYYEWIPFTELSELPDTPSIKIQLWLDVSPGETSEWIPENWFGVSIPEFAVWTDNLNQSLNRYFAMNEASGSTWVDATKRGDGIMGSGVSYNIPGKLNTCIGFNGTENHNNVSYDTGGNFAVSLWNYIIDDTSNQYVFSNSPSNDREIQITSGNVRFLIDNSGGNFPAYSIPSTNAWYHIVVQYNSTDKNASIWVNGLVRDSVILSSLVSSDAITHIGGKDAGSDVKGWIDEVAIFNSSLNSASILNLYGSGTPPLFPPKVNEPPTITLNSPANHTNYSVADVTFNYTIKDDYNVSNYTFFIDDVANYTIIYGGSNETTNITTLTFADGSYNWSVRAYDNDTKSTNSSTRFFTVDTTLPLINVTYPFGTIDYMEAGTNLTINFTATDTNLESCWYSWDGGSINKTTTCAFKNISQNITSPNNVSITFYANDSVGNENSITRTWDYRLFYLNQTYVSSVLEGSSNEFKIVFETNGSSINVGVLNYNNTNYTGSINSVGNTYTLTRTTTAPIVTVTTNISFDWFVQMSGYQKLMGSYNQTVSEVEITNNCTGRYVVYNLTMVDEQNKTEINETVYNNSIKVDLTLYNTARTTTIQTYSNNFLGINPAPICIDNNLSEGDQFVMDMQIQYSAINYSEEMYYIENYTLNSSTLNQNLTLFDLLITDTQKFKIIARNPSYIPYSNILVQIDRQYIDDGVFNTTEIPKTDESGITSASLEVDDILYNIYLIQNGVTIKSFLNTRAICQTPAISTCELDLNVLAEAITIPDYTIGDDFNFTLGYNSTSKVISSSFLIPSGEPELVLLQVTSNDALGTSVCTDSVTSASGTLSCTVPGSFGNSTVIAKLFKANVEQGKGTIKTDQEPSEIFGVVLVVLSIIVLLTFIGIAITGNPVVSAVMLFMGAIVLFSLNLVKNTGFIGKGASILFLAIGIILVIIKAGRRT